MPHYLITIFTILIYVESKLVILIHMCFVFKPMNLRNVKDNCFDYYDCYCERTIELVSFKPYFPPN